MSSFKEKLSKSGQSVLDARAQNLYELTKIEEDRFIQDCKLKVLRIQGEINKHNDLAVKSRDSLNPGENLNPADATESINLDDVKEDVTNPLDN